MQQTLKRMGLSRWHANLARNRSIHAFSDLVVVQAGSIKLSGVRANRRGEHIAIEPAALEEGPASPTVRQRVPVVVVLPKSMYLLRQLTLPTTAADETDQMLRLEVEAHLPPEFDETIISYRPLANQDSQRDRRYEVYIVQRKEIDPLLTKLQEQEIQPDYILPSAYLWSSLLPHKRVTADLLVAAVSPQDYETIAVSDGTLRVRTIHALDELDLEHGLAEAVRLLASQRSAANGSIAIGWLGAERPGFQSPDAIIHDCSDVFPDSPVINTTSTEQVPPMLRLAAVALLHLEELIPATVNLLPDEITLRRQRRGAFGLIGSAAGSFLLALVVLGLALEIAVSRYDTYNEQLAVRITEIKADGETVGRQLNQLRAVQQARATRNDFSDVLGGLLASTPEGVSYSQVTLTDGGQLQLRGHAASLASPFLLPERLEAQPMFRSVLVNDAGQAKRGEGSVVEFSAEAQRHRDQAR